MYANTISSSLRIEKYYIKLLVYFTQKELSLDELYQAFYFHYMDKCPDLEKPAEEFFGEICEKMDFTSDAANPDEEDRKYGWIHVDEFRLWLIQYLNDNHTKLNF